MSIGPLAAAGALAAYRGTDAAAAPAGADFSSFLGNALDSAIAAGHQADAASQGAVTGRGDLTQVVTAVSRAQLALQTTVAVRDRVLQAYQDIIKMPI